ncbi:MAG: hypothetical protein IJN94_08855, partial [Clostridia bacterium]|nr:hypothetical protein [Clostridia bacterium]
ETTTGGSRPSRTFFDGAFLRPETFHLTFSTFHYNGTTRPFPTLFLVRLFCGTGKPVPYGLLSFAKLWRLATGDWRLVTGDWQLATGDW